MKKIVFASVLILALLLAACGGAAQQPAETEAEEIIVSETVEETAPAAEEPAPAEDGQNPVMNFIGTYAAGRPSIHVACEGADGARFTVYWSSSAWEHSEWTMSGKLDLDTLTVRYTDCVRKDVTANEDGSVFTDSIVYENGSGSITFLAEENALTWNDGQEHMADELIFHFTATEDPAYYSAFSAMDKGAIEAFAMEIRNAYLGEDWAAIADHARYPILVSGVSCADRESFLAFMEGCTLSDTARTEMTSEFCHDMFFNGQGLCLGSGQVWLLDPSYMTDNEPTILVISLNDIVAR